MKFVNLIVFVIVVLLLGAFFINTQDNNTPELTDQNGDTSTEEQIDVDLPRSIRTFTDDEFKEAYDNLSLPNITPIIAAPEITGSMAADSIIREAAEARGYRLRDVASGLLNSTDDVEVQELLIQSWQELKQDALNDGYQISVYSGYRSIEEQRSVFNQRLFATGVTIDEIIVGLASDQIDAVLQVTAPPGYSRHHGGYTIDVEDPDYFVFAQSPSYDWLAEDNFVNAKKHGFIPSYPDGATNQGPNPEPWEYVWVGPTVTYE